MSATKQVNVELPEITSRRIKSDASGLGVTLNAYAEQAFERFLSLTVEQRRIYLGERKQKKLSGRKVRL